MKKIIITISAITLVIGSTTWVSAQDNNGGIVPMLYMNMPFGDSSSAKDVSSYGMALVTKAPSQIGSDITAPVNLLDSSSPRLLDMRFNQEGFDSLKLNGVSLVQRVITYNADGTTNGETTTTDLSLEDWLMLGFGAAGVLCAADVICDDPDPDPPAEEEEEEISPQ
jgi:hypothetical protein